MKTLHLIFVWMFAAALAGIIAASAQAQTPESGNWQPNELLVKLMPGIEETGQDKVITDLLDARKKGKIYGTDVWVMEIPDVVTLDGRKLDNPEKIAEHLRQSPHPYIEYAEPNYLYTIGATIPNDPMYSNIWGMNAIQAPEAWDTDHDCSEVVVGVIDSGVDWKHPDLVNNIWQNLGEDADGDGHVLEFIGGTWQFDPGDVNGIDNDGNGFADDFVGWDFVNNDNNPMDDNSHGTHCAGTIGAWGNNSIGVAGVCWDVKIMALKFIPAIGGGFSSAAVAALNYATNKGVKITSNSWGSGWYSTPLYNAIQNAQNNDALFVAAAGNTATNNDLYPHYPSSYTLPNIIAVASSMQGDVLSSFSCYGANSVDLAAPGSGIYSTTPNNSYGYKNGTSMATPHVAGAAALVWCPGMTYTTLKNTLLNQVDVLPAFAGKCVSGGRLNVFKALSNATCCTAAASFTSPAAPYCTNQVLAFVNTSVNATAYQWKVDNILQSTGTNFNYIFTSPGLHTVTLIASAGSCSDAYTQIIAANTAPNAGFSTTVSNLSLVVTGIAGATAYTWNFGDGTTASGVTATHTYATPGTYSVCLTASNTCGSNNICQSIVVTDPCADVWTTYNTSNSSLPHNNVTNIAVDANGNKWIATNEFGTGTGLTKFNNNSWTTYTTSNSGLPSNYINAITIDAANNIWIGTNNGLSKFDGTNWTTYNTSNSGLPSNYIQAIAIDATNNKLIGAENGGLAKFSGNSWTVYNSSNSGLVCNHINTIAIDNSSHIWVGCEDSGSLIKFDGINWSYYDTDFPFPNDGVRAISIDSQGNKWISTTTLSGAWGGDGISKFDGTNWTTYATYNSELTDDFVRCITIDAADNIWIGTQSGGVNKFDGTTWIIYNTANSGLSSNGVNSITIDATGSKWIGTGGGISVLGNCSATCPATPSFTAPTTTCINSPAVFTNTSTGASSYQWFVNNVAAGTGSNLTYTFTDAGSYIVKLVASNGSCSNQYAQTITVLDNCVWPGDANADGTVSMLDWLALGLAYNKTGPPRTDQTINFDAKPAANFATAFNGSLFNGVNHKHADCNGNGIVNAADTTAIVQNFGLSHALDPADIPLSDNPEALLSMQTNTPAVATGASAFIDITIANAINGGALSCYGMAFTLHYRGANPRLHFNGSCLGTIGTDFIATYRADEANELLHVGITRINQTNAIAQGIIATLEVSIDETPASGAPLSLNMSITGAAVDESEGYLIPAGAGTSATLDVYNYLALEQPPLLNAKVLLQGALSGDVFLEETEMQTTLRNNNLLPAQQPYNSYPWLYNGTENVGIPANLPANAVDWVLLELCTAAEPNSLVWRKAALLLSDGSIQDAVNPIPGRVRLETTLPGGGQSLVPANADYYLIVRHRNHLAVASSVPLPISGNMMTCNFTQTPTNTMGGIGQLAPAGSRYALKAGDLNANGIFNVTDYNAYAANPSAVNQYLPYDCNLDGMISVADFNLLAPNLSTIGVFMVRYYEGDL